MLHTKTLKALGDETRLQILELLKKQNLSVNEIAKNFDITLPSLSHHLKTLKEADLVSSNRHGQEIVYSLNLSVMEEIGTALIKFFKK